MMSIRAELMERTPPRRNINLRPKTIAEQILLRDLSGSIVIDYIEMSDPQDSEAILEAMTSALAGSKSAIDILPINAFGLMHITRQRKAQPLWEKQLTFCTSCSGKGSILGLSVQAHDLVRELRVKTSAKIRLSHQLYDCISSKHSGILKFLQDTPSLQVEVLENEKFFEKATSYQILKATD